MKTILTLLFMVSVFAATAQVTAISPNHAYQGQSLGTSITSSSLFLTGSSPQGNIQNIILKNATDSAFAVSDSTNVVSTSTATTFWNLPANLATGIYSLVVRIYNSLFSGPTTDYTLTNGFTVNAATSTISGTVYNDLNHNGIRDAGEPGIPGYTIHLRPLGNIAVSDTGGNYIVTSVPGLDTIIIEQPADDIYRTAVPASYIFNVPAGATTGKNFGLVLYRYITGMTADTATVGQSITAAINTSDVFKNATINNVALRNSANGGIINGYNFSVTDTNTARASFSFSSYQQTGHYDLIVVVRSTIDSNLRTFILDSAFTLYGPVGFISGYAFADSNANGIKDAGEAGLAGQYIEISGPVSYSASTDASGYYHFNTLPNGTYTVTTYNPNVFYGGCTSSNISYSTPTTYIVTINRDTANNKNFGITSSNTGSQYDLFIHPGWRPPNPGFPRHYWIFYGNNSSVTVPSGVITFQYDPSLTFDSCDRTPASNDLVTHTLTWNIDTIAPTPQGPWFNGPGGWYGGWYNFNLYMTVSPADTAGQLLTESFSISPTANDCNPSDNTVTDISPVTSSRDPNEKHSSPYGGLYTGEDSVVTYTINFQNTGTASTHFVIVVDTLDPNFDYRTVVSAGGSAPFKLNNNKGILTFTLDPLVLTDSASDANHSVGFVSFMVKVKTGTHIGTVIHNTAYVFFDYNSAVITNTAINEVAAPLGILNMKNRMNVQVRPNPFDESTTVSFSNPAHDKYTLTLYDAAGNEVKAMSGNDVQFLIHKDGLVPGVYLYRLINQSTKQSAQGKIVVM